MNVHKENFELNKDGINELMGELENAPLMSDLSKGFLNAFPEIKLDVEPKDSGVDVHLSVKFNISNIWKSKDGVGKALSNLITNATGGLAKGNLNVFLVFKVDFINKFEVYQDVSLTTGYFSTIATKTTTTKLGFYIEVEGGIVNINDDVATQTFGKDEYKELKDMFKDFY